MARRNTPRAQLRKTARKRRAAPGFPGATFELDEAGQITGVWLGRAAPPVTSSTDILAALDIAEQTTEAAQIQVLLASAIGQPVDAWAVIAADAPTLLHRRDGRLLAATWDARAANGAIDRVAMFVLPVETATSDAPSPVEHGEICRSALELLQDCSESLGHLARDPRDGAPLHHLFRALHTLKGLMRGDQLRAIRELAHQAEDAIARLRDREEVPPHSLVELVRFVERLRAEVTAARSIAGIDDMMTYVLRECRSARVDLQMAAPRLSVGDRSGDGTVRRAIERIRAASARARMAALGAQCASSATALAELSSEHSRRAGLLDEVVLLDRQLELYAAVYRELKERADGPALLAALTSRARELEMTDQPCAALAALVDPIRLPRLARALLDADPQVNRCAVALVVDAPAMFEPCPPEDEAVAHVGRAQGDVSVTLDELRERLPETAVATLRTAIARIGYVPLAALEQRLAATVDSLARELHKRCRAKIDLGDVTVSPKTARALNEILVHAVRNAIDHGIESPVHRVAAGKTPEGTIEIVAYPAVDRLVVTVRDDGRGLNLEYIQRRAAEQGIAATAPIPEVMDLVFTPGFSTARDVTLISGRGVGMDAIRRTAEQLGGSVALASTPGRGTELAIAVAL